MAGSINTTSFKAKVKELNQKVKKQSMKALGEMSDELLRLSSFEVPHDEGLLQTSGTKQPERDYYIVGYNKVYAARLHEHPEYNFKKGRKGKYLEDPLKNNMKVFKDFYKKTMEKIFK